MKTRKQLPPFGKISLSFDITQLQMFCRENGFCDYSKYNDIKYSSNSRHQKFLVANSFNKESFFKESDAPFLEGEKYKQLYLTDISQDKCTTAEEKLLNNLSIHTRMKRLNPQRPEYVPEADELMYTQRNENVKGLFAEILDQFKSQVTRVRLAALMPQFEIRPHIDYDPSYITRYHIPIFTNSEVKFGVKSSSGSIEFTMPADGSVYFLNTGLKHWVKNEGSDPRLHLIVDTHGQNDLKLM